MFNKELKNEIQNLKDRLEVAETKIRGLENKPVGYFKMGEEIPDDSILGLVGQYIEAIRDYLKIDFKGQWEDDPTAKKPMPKKRRVIIAKKLKVE